MLELTFRLVEMLVFTGAVGLASLHSNALAPWLLSMILRWVFPAYGLGAPMMAVRLAREGGPIGVGRVAGTALAAIYLTVLVAATWILFDLESFAGLLAK